MAFVSTLGFFWQLYVATKYSADGANWLFPPTHLAAHKLMTRGNVIGLVGATMLVQLGLACWFRLALTLLLLPIWGYVWLISQGFWAHTWLKGQPLVHLLSQIMVIPFIFFYITACDWLVSGAAPPTGLAWYLIAGFFTGMIFEIGCNIRAPQDEEAEIETYSQLWGRRTSVTIWLLAIALTGLSLAFAAETLRASILLLALAFGLLTSAVLIGERFLETPRTLYAASIHKFSALCMVLLYLGLAVMPIFFA
ncbi:MAG: hypothetical protein U0350_06045 [Caldilineaceae bacterium]